MNISYDILVDEYDTPWVHYILSQQHYDLYEKIDMFLSRKIKRKNYIDLDLFVCKMVPEKLILELYNRYGLVKLLEYTKNLLMGIVDCDDNLTYGFAEEIYNNKYKSRTYTKIYKKV